MKRSLSLLLLALGAGLAGAPRAQDPADLAPAQTMVAIRFASMDKLAEIVGSFLAATGEEMPDLGEEMFGEFHSLEGMDRAKPIFVFMAAPEMAPWFALPVADAGAFGQGCRLPAKPIMKGGYGLVSPALMGGDEEEGKEAPQPALGCRDLGALPAGDVVVRIMADKALQQFGGQLEGFKMMIGMMAPAMGLQPEQGEALTKVYDQVVALGRQAKNLDLAFTGGKQMRLAVTMTGAPGTALAGLGKGIKPGLLPPAPGGEPLLWGWMGAELTPDAPKEIKALLEALEGMKPQAGEQGALARALGNAAAMALLASPGGQMCLVESMEVKDAGAAAKAIGTREEIVAMVRASLSQLPAMGMAEGMPDLKGMAEQLLEKMEFEAEAFAVAGNPVSRMSVGLAEVAEGMPEEALAIFQKMLGGDRLQAWLGVTGKHLTMAFGAEELARQAFAAAAAGPAPLPAYAVGAFAAGHIKLGALAKTVFKMVPAGELPKGFDPAKLPEGLFRFRAGTAEQGLGMMLSGNMDDLVGLIKMLSSLAEGDEEEGEEPPDEGKKRGGEEEEPEEAPAPTRRIR